jgi:hypothetical protein
MRICVKITHAPPPSPKERLALIPQLELAYFYFYINASRRTTSVPANMYVQALDSVDLLVSVDPGHSLREVLKTHLFFYQIMH